MKVDTSYLGLHPVIETKTRPRKPAGCTLTHVVDHAQCLSRYELVGKLGDRRRRVRLCAGDGDRIRQSIAQKLEVLADRVVCRISCRTLIQEGSHIVDSCPDSVERNR